MVREGTIDFSIQLLNRTKMGVFVLVVFVQVLTLWWTVHGHAYLESVDSIGLPRGAADRANSNYQGQRFNAFTTGIIAANSNANSNGCPRKSTGNAIKHVVVAGSFIKVAWVVSIPHHADRLSPGVRIALEYSADEVSTESGRSFNENILAAGIDAGGDFAGQRVLATVMIPPGRAGFGTLQWFWAARNDDAYYLDCVDVHIVLPTSTSGSSSSCTPTPGVTTTPVCVVMDLARFHPGSSVHSSSAIADLWSTICPSSITTFQSAEANQCLLQFTSACQALGSTASLSQQQQQQQQLVLGSLVHASCAMYKSFVLQKQQLQKQLSLTPTSGMAGRSGFLSAALTAATAANSVVTPSSSATGAQTECRVVCVYGVPSSTINTCDNSYIQAVSTGVQGAGTASDRNSVLIPVNPGVAVTPVGCPGTAWLCSLRI
jgi:hypothetical protein